MERFDDRATLLIHGKHSYRAKSATVRQVRSQSLEHALESSEDRLRERTTVLAQSHRQATDLAKQLDQPFEHEEKLSAASLRQQKIIAALDITKNQASASVPAESIKDDGVTERRRQVIRQGP